MSTCDIYTYFFGACSLFICSFALLLSFFSPLFFIWFLLLRCVHVCVFFFAQFILTFHIRRGDVSNVSYVSQFYTVFIWIIRCCVSFFLQFFLFGCSMSCSFTQSYIAFHIVFDHYYLFGIVSIHSNGLFVWWAWCVWHYDIHTRISSSDGGGNRRGRQTDTRFLIS